MLLTLEEFRNFWKSKGIYVNDLDYFCYLIGDAYSGKLRRNPTKF